MKSCWYQSGLMVLGLGGIAASHAVQPDDLVRQGNAAFARGDFVQASDAYAQAEDRTTDPGLVAFNEGTALYQQGRYREAELHFRRCRSDALGLRRARLLYNLGNCLVQQARGQDVARLKDAIAVYEECLQQQSDDALLTADARHNLELARLLFLQAKSRKEGSDRANQESDTESPPPSDSRDDPRTAADNSGSQGPDSSGKPHRGAEAGGDANAATKANQQPAAGKGDLPPIPDADDLTPLSPEDAAEHLQQAAARIAGERRTHRQRPMPPAPPNVKDW